MRPFRLRYAASALAILAVGAGIKHFVFPSRPPPKYIVATAKLGSIEQTVLASGILVPSQLVSVGAQVSGQITALNVELGDKVRKGELIATIDPVPLQNALRNAEAALAQDRAQLAADRVTLGLDEVTLKRQAGVLEVQAISQADYDVAKAAVDKDRANIAALEAQITQAAIAVDTARVNLGYTKISSPIDGEIIATLVKQGQTVNSVYSTPTIVKVAKLDTMTVKAQISEADVIKVDPGQKVYFTIMGDPGHRYYAKLRAIEPATEAFANETSASSASSNNDSSNPAVYYNALFDVDNPGHKLRASMTVQVNVVLAEADHAVMLPSNALLPADAPAADPPGKDQPGADTPAGAEAPISNAWAQVNVVDAAGATHQRRVRVGINNSIDAQILQGLAAGERVAIGAAPPPDAAAAKP